MERGIIAGAGSGAPKINIIGPQSNSDQVT